MDLTFKGRAKRLDDIDLPKLGALIGVGEDELHAFLDVETRGTGFDSVGRPRILFERHKFLKYVPAAKLGHAMAVGLADKQPGGYGKESDQYPKLLRAIAIDRQAALYSCSWGLGQVMGFNHKLAGYDTVEAMVAAFMDDEEAHLKAAVTFIKNAHLDDELRAHNWAAFAKGYNGTNYAINRYDVKLAEAYRKWSRIKNTVWTPGSATSPVAPPLATPAPTPAPKPATPAATNWLAALIAAILSIFKRKAA
ncbi:N-acetylmuramidase family protein [Mesorhizobium sp.]|uniref:N-acetylmuramidase family protein n=1 Tax=Mesorhizobium sp. TaxID=1871066 RepID=UPI001216D6E9|nr:N-acetylmuramidase family protein [Mesorhizobium sp.]TIL38511.1 MAG: N-acetylmuramidase family protein [Mesorhizobium sp.]